MACLGDQNSFASIMRLGLAPPGPAAKRVAHHGQALEIPVQVAADLELARPDAVLCSDIRR